MSSLTDQDDVEMVYHGGCFSVRVDMVDSDRLSEITAWGEYDMQQTQLAARDRKLPRRFLRISFLCRFICYAEMNLGIINQNTIKDGLLFNSWRTCVCGCMWEV